MTSWPARFLDLAKHIAGWSKDPSTQVGAVAINDARAIVETGYNGLPRGVADLPERMERPAKYLWTAHAARDRLAGTTVYVTHMCCASCTRMLINAGVRRVVVGPGVTSMPPEQFEIAQRMFCEAGVELSTDGGNP